MNNLNLYNHLLGHSISQQRQSEMNRLISQFGQAAQGGIGVPMPYSPGAAIKEEVPKTKKEDTSQDDIILIIEEGELQ